MSDAPSHELAVDAAESLAADGELAAAPSLPALDHAPPPAEAEPPPVDQPPPSLEPLYDIPVTVQAVLGGSTMPIADLLELRTGSVVELDRRVGEPVDLLVNGRVIARGELVLLDGDLGVTLTEVVKAER